MNNLQVNFGGANLSCCDSDRSALMVFLAGCPYICQACQNSGLRTTRNFVSIDFMKELIKNDSRFVSEVIFSGGEPFFQMDALIELARYVKSLGLKVGVETSGFESHNAMPLFDDHLVDFIYVDFKTSPCRYPEVTGNENSFGYLVELMDLCRSHGVPCEVRTTNVPGIVTPEIIEMIKNIVETYGFPFKLQEYRKNG